MAIEFKAVRNKEKVVEVTASWKKDAPAPFLHRVIKMHVSDATGAKELGSAGRSLRATDNNTVIFRSEFPQAVRLVITLDCGDDLPLACFAIAVP